MIGWILGGDDDSKVFFFSTSRGDDKVPLFFHRRWFIANSSIGWDIPVAGSSWCSTGIGSIRGIEIESWIQAADETSNCPDVSKGEKQK